MEGKDAGAGAKGKFSGISPYGLYEAALIGLGVNPVDAKRCASRLPYPPLIDVEEVWKVACNRLEQLSLIGQSPFDKVLEKHLEGNFPWGPEIWYLGQSVVEELNKYLEPRASSLTLADLMRPESKSHRRLSTWGAYDISARLELVPFESLGSALDYAIYEISTGHDPDEALNQMIKPISRIGRLIKGR